MLKKRLFIGLCMILLLVGFVSATDYYYNCTSGNDANDCSTGALACQSLSDLQGKSLSTGDKVYSNGCEICRGSYVSAENGVTYDTYGDCGKWKIYGSINNSVWTNLSGGLWETQANFTYTVGQIFYNTTGDVQLGLRNNSFPNENWEWAQNGSKILLYLDTGNPEIFGNGIEIPKYNGSVYQSVFEITGDNNIVQNLQISFTRLRALAFYDGATNNTLRNCELNYGYEKSLWIEGDNNILNNNSLYLCGIRGQVAPYGQSAMGECFWITQNSGTKIYDNVIERCGGVCINMYHAKNTNVTRNRVFNPNQDVAQPEWSAGIYFDGCNNSVATYNNVSDTQIGLQVGSEIAGWTSNNISFEHNIVVGAKLSDMLLDSGLGTKQLFKIIINQNTFYKINNYTGSGFGNQIFLSNYDDVTFNNNIIYNNYTSTTAGRLIMAENGTTGDHLVSDYNSWNSTSGVNKWYFKTTDYTTLAAWTTASGGQDTNSITANPLFTDVVNGDFRPIAGSPACNMSSTGSYVGAIPCADTSPPGNITNLLSPSQGENWIFINWTNPTDTDFNHTEVFRNETSIANLSVAYLNSTGLPALTSYTYRLVPIDHTGNRGNNTTISNITKDLTSPVVNILNSSFNTSSITPSISFNFTDSVSSTANCTIYFTEV